MEFKQINNKKILDILNYLNKQRKHEYNNGENQGTKNAIYVVQERYMNISSHGFFEDEVLSIDGDYLQLDDIHHGILDTGIEDCFEQQGAEYINSLKKRILESTSLVELKDVLDECGFGDMYDNIDILSFEYKWKDIAIFITRDEAEDYRHYQFHNLLGGSRIHVTHSGYRNNGSLNKLLELLDTIDIFGGEKL